MKDNYTVQEAGQVLRISDKTVYRWIQSGKIKGRKVGQKWLISRQEINRVMGGGA